MRFHPQLTQVTALRRRLVGEAEAQLAAGGEALSDEFLARWLRARGRDVVAAEEAVRAHARWRAEFVPKGRVLEVGVFPFEFCGDLSHEGRSGVDSTENAQSEHRGTKKAPLREFDSSSFGLRRAGGHPH